MQDQLTDEQLMRINKMSVHELRWEYADLLARILQLRVALDECGSLAFEGYFKATTVKDLEAYCQVIMKTAHNALENDAADTASQALEGGE